METQEVESAKKDLLNGYLLGLDDVILADGEGFNEFIKNLKINLLRKQEVLK